METVEYPNTGQDEVDQIYLISELRSHNLNYKATLHQRGRKKIFAVSVYHWLTEGNEENEGQPVWERIIGPNVFEDLETAEKFAAEELRLAAGEKIDIRISDELLHWVREYTGDHTADFLDPTSFVVRRFTSKSNETENSEEITPANVLFVLDLYLVKNNEKWLLGMIQEDGHIDCWQNFDSLEEALDVIKKEE
jgi:hypothetical protein